MKNLANSHLIGVSVHVHALGSDHPCLAAIITAVCITPGHVDVVFWGGNYPGNSWRNTVHVPSIHRVMEMGASTGMFAWHWNNECVLEAQVGMEAIG